jgi:RNA polymerase sigma-70 factor, ECF subfamily
MAEQSDNELIERAKEGDKRAFEVLYERYERRILDFTYRYLHDMGLAEEVTQNTFLAVYRNLHRYHAGKSAAPWIFRIAQNMACSRYRHEKKSKRDVSLDAVRTEDEQPMLDFVETKEPNPQEMLRAKEYHEEIQKAIDSLPEKYKTVLILHDVEGLSYEEIQGALGIPYNTAAGRLATARLMFQKKINPNVLGLELFFRFLSEGERHELVA